MTKVSSGAFWGWSLALYRRPGVAAACLDLQDRYGCDVNLVLYALWVGDAGRGRLSAAGLDAAKAVLAPWHDAIVAPLRALRRRAEDEPGAASLYAALKAAELEAEHVGQDRLETVAPPAGAGDAAPLDAAAANLAAYIGPAGMAAAAPLLRALAETGAKG